MSSEQTAEEMYESVNGFDRIAIRQSMGVDLVRDAETDPVGVTEALVFTHFRRAGKSDSEARAATLNLTLKELMGYFAEDPEEIDPDAPDTPAGNG